jgi:uncharacterized protein YlbG (UPF0298 family)
LTNTPSPNLTNRVKDGAGVAWSFIQLLLKKAPVAVDTNPVKIVFGIAQIALELKKVRALSRHLGSSLLLKEPQGMQDNMDATERRIAALLDLILVVEKATRDWRGTSRDETRAMKAFERCVAVHWSSSIALYLTHRSRTLSKELDNFIAIREQSRARQFLVQEVDKQNIADIFERVNEARQNLIVRSA